MLLHNGFYAIVSRGAPSNLSTRRNLASVWKRTVWKRRSFVVLRNAIIHGSQYGRFIGIRTSYPYELWLNTFTYLIRWKIWVHLKGRFFQKVWCIFLIAQKMCRKLSWKRDIEILFGLESADSNCTAVSKGGKIQNTKLRIEHSTSFGQWK